MSHQQQPQPPNAGEQKYAPAAPAPQPSGAAGGGESSGMIQQHHAQSAAAAAMAAAAAAAAAAQGTAPGAHPVFDLAKFWQEQLHVAESFESDFKNHPLPLARIKKVMKTDQDVKMISAEAPILFAKGCEIFITELTKRAWVHAEENKRRTLQRSDIATAISKTDMCDFLIDIVPREEAAKSNSAVYDQNAYQYYQSANVPQYTSAQQIDPAAYYPQLSQLTPEQMQQYQLQLQQFAAQQHPYAQQMQQQQQQQQQQSRPNAPGQSAAGSSGQASSSDGVKSESQQQQQQHQ